MGLPGAWNLVYTFSLFFLSLGNSIASGSGPPNSFKEDQEKALALQRANSIKDMSASKGKVAKTDAEKYMFAVSHAHSLWAMDVLIKSIEVWTRPYFKAEAVLRYWQTALAKNALYGCSGVAGPLLLQLSLGNRPQGVVSEGGD